MQPEKNSFFYCRNGLLTLKQPKISDLLPSKTCWINERQKENEFIQIGKVIHFF